ncbi:PAS domain-containing sensor histidine kinase [Spirosoma lacussanchae]|uniref:PAS domain-containing sensor histidine kinase n=1 Tax=Spirosoma lacussanchae TaxID=1884249 RepID=UPI00110966A2|nr:ATP-binding protein [Spirosoma lacussanchae]
MASDTEFFNPDSLTENERLSFALQAAGVGTWDWDPIRERVRWDERCKALYGFSGDDLVPYEHVLNQVHPDDLPRLRDALTRAINPDSGGQYDVRFRTVAANDGQLRWLHCQGKAYFNAEQIAYRMSGIVQDVTSQILDREALQRSEDRLQTILKHAPIGLGLLSGPDFTFELVNEQLAQMAGRPSGQLKNRPLLEALPELSEQGLKAIFDTVRQTGQRFVAPELPVMLERNGQLETAYFYASFEPVQEPDGSVSIVDFSLEITQQLQDRRRLEDSEARFRNIVELAPFAVAVYESEDLIISVANESMIRIWGKTPAVIGQKLATALPELEGQPFIPLLNNVFQTGQLYRTNEQPADLIVGGQLQTFWFNFVYQPLTDLDGRVYAILNMAVDVTERVMARQQIEQSESRYRNLAAELEVRVQERTQELHHINQELKRSNDNLQQFAYVASHDLQEPLRKIQSFSSLLTEHYQTELSDEVKDLLQRMAAAGSRMSTLIHDLLTYSRITTRKRVLETVSLNEVISTVLNTLQVTIDERSASIQIDPLPIINGDQSQLEQLFQNLLSNALKFTPANRAPSVQIAYGICEVSELPATISVASEAGRFHRISVTDQGIGFDEKYLDRIFQVFQRLHSKSEFPGTGVGLAICQQVAENHGGGLTATSKLGQGATFSLYLPA